MEKGELIDLFQARVLDLGWFYCALKKGYSAIFYVYFITVEKNPVWMGGVLTMNNNLQYLVEVLGPFIFLCVWGP